MSNTNDTFLYNQIRYSFYIPKSIEALYSEEMLGKKWVI